MIGRHRLSSEKKPSIFRQDVIQLKSVRSRLPILIAASVILCAVIAVLSMVIINYGDRSMMEDKINENKASMQQTTANFQKELNGKCDFILSVANSLSDTEQQGFESVMNRHKKHLDSYAEKGGFTQVLLSDLDGTAYSADGTTYDISARNYFRKAVLGGSGVSEPVSPLIAETSDQSLVFYAPIYSGNVPVGVLLGLTPAGIDMAAYTDTSTDLAAGMYVLDANGNLVMTSLTADSVSFYNTVKSNKYADGTDSDYREMEALTVSSEPENDETAEQTEQTQQQESEETTPVLSEKSTDFYAGDITAAKGLFGWLSKDKDTSTIFFKKNLSQNGWKLFYVRTVKLSERTVAFIVISRVLLGSIVLIFLVAMIVMLWLQWLSNKRITNLAYKDDITGRANWQKFQAVCNRRLNNKSWWKTNHAALHINVNRFTTYQEYYGHKAGDSLLRYIAETLELMCSAKEMCAHREGNQFVVLWSYTDKQQLETRIHDFFTLLHDGPNGENVSVTVGVYPVAKNDKDIVEVMDLASLTAQNAEDAKVNTIVYFDEKIKAQIHEEKELEGLMHIALANEEFKLYLQPKHRVKDGSLAGAEALVRWINPDKGFISPGRFIPLFEKNGFVDEVDNYMLEQLCKFQQKRLLLDKRLVPISVNVSRVQLSDPELAQKICKLVDYYKVPHKYIDLELTESACFDDMDVLVNTINSLREMGFPVSMDDFGSGYSSLNLLKQLSFDTLKIDGEFFRHVTDPERANAVVRSIIDMAKSLNMKTVAEGIETDEQVAFLRTTDCDLIQGYYYSKPISAEEFETYMLKNKIRDI